MLLLRPHIERGEDAAKAASEARPAPSSHLSAIPIPACGMAPQNTPSAPVLTKARGTSLMSRVQKRPVPATMKGERAPPR